MERRAARIGADAALVAALAGLMFFEAWVGDEPVSPLAAAAVVVAALPALLWRRHPAWGLVAGLAAIFVVLSFVDVHNTAPFASMWCGYHLALVMDRRRARWIAIAVVPVVVAAIVIFARDDLRTLWVEIPKNLAFIAAPFLLGAAVRNRNDYLAAVLDRAENAERTREEEAARRVSEERLRIAQDVHDVVAHAMVAINVQAGVGLHLLDRDPERARQTLADIRSASGDALVDLRSTLGVLRSDTPVAPAPSLGDLAELAGGLRSAGLAVALEVDPTALTVPAGVGSTGYRIVQEALTNVVRHAGSAHAQVAVRRLEGEVVIEVADPGPALARPSAPEGSGNGVRGMVERAAAVGGTVEAGPDGAGWRVRAVLPA